MGGTQPITDGLAIGGDASVILGVPDGDTTAPMFLASVKVGVQPEREIDRSRFQPFLLFGAALVGADVGWTVEAGTAYWISSSIGLRADARLLRPFGGEGGAVTVQIGLSLR